MSDETAKPPRLAVLREASAHDLQLPRYATAGSAGMDLCADVPRESPVELQPGEWCTVSTGLRVQVPVGFEAQVRARSGLASRSGIGLLNGIGTIDSDYRGVVSVILMNWGRESFVVNRGDRIAQLVLAAAPQVELVEVAELADTSRGDGGFGSTGCASPR
ncbi:MAG: dUTP diphosphatase [Armatimonadetes bacterium]|nr:dUTP diphosphatase [Armatimonadota bacterium]MDE2206549.1 dUTP diphosphatase [Armatimonadota bacterium]